MYYYMAVITLFSGCQEELYYLRRSQGPKPPYWRHWEPVLYGGDERICCWTRGPIVCRFICWMLIFFIITMNNIVIPTVTILNALIRVMSRKRCWDTLRRFFLKRKWRDC